MIFLMMTSIIFTVLSQLEGTGISYCIPPGKILRGSPVKNGSPELIRVGSGVPFRNDSVAPLTVFRFRSSGTSRENAPFPE